MMPEEPEAPETPIDLEAEATPETPVIPDALPTPSEPWWKRSKLGPFLGVSIAVHAIGFSLLPLFSLGTEAPESEPYTEIMLLPQPEEMELVAAPAIGANTGPASSRAERQAEDAPYLPADLPTLLGRAQAIRGPEAAVLPQPDLELPQSTAPEPRLDLSAHQLPLYAQPDAPQTQRPTAGDLLSESNLHSEMATAAPPTPREHTVDLQRVDALVEGARGTGAAQGLQGPAAERIIVEQPEIPALAVEEDTILRLRFWVLADGTVGEVYPLQKGDAALERVALEYMRRWRFNGLSKGNEKVWGEITIRFRPQ